MKIIWGMLEPLEEYQIIAKKFNEKIKDLTKGEIEVETILFDKDPENPLKEIEKGDLDIYQVTSTQLSSILPEQTWLNVWEIPFLFKSNQHVEDYINSLRTADNLKKLETEKVLPLTYSYAGGFCGMVTKRNKQVEDYSDLSKIEYSEFEYEDMSLEDFLMNIYQHLPSTVLMYEVNELLKLNEECKKLINVDVTNHLVVARITMVSKDTLSKIPEEFREEFLDILHELLEQERNVIYARAAKNTDALKADGVIGYNEQISQDKQILDEMTYVSSIQS
jgi:TRAP-type C4-dicarboxylate transport system substrate-binding protein